MSGLIDTNGLNLGTGLSWLSGGLGQAGLVITTSTSAAAELLALYGPQGVAIVFDDDQSMAIVDSSTPANNYSSSGTVSSAGALIGPGGKLTYTSPSAKLTLQSTGLYKYNAHNLYLNSAAPANQAITVTSGATYEIVITGTVSITWSGAYVGTTTSGTTAFTAATGTLTGGSTSGSGTVAVRRTPVNSDYVATTSTALYALPYEWDTAGLLLGVKIELAATNVVLRNRDLTNASWTKTNCTAAKDQTGIDGVSNSASSLTASAGNATCLQAITLASSARYQTAFVKRLTGSGTIEMTMDNGTTWTAVTVTASWSRVSIPKQTLANPTVGFRIVTSGDAVAIDFVQNENSTVESSPIEVPAGSTVTRAVDQVAIADTLFPTSTTGLLLFAQFTARNFAANRYICYGNAGQTNYFEIVHNASNQVRGASDGTNGIAIANFNTYTSGTVKAALSAKLNEARMAVNGVGLTPDTVCTVPNPDALYISGRTPTFGAMNAPIQKVMLLPRSAVDQAEINAMTV